jgi:hypothetical protein
LPVVKCKDKKTGKPGYKVANTNGCPHTYDPSSESSRKKAKKDCYVQWYAIQKKTGKAEILNAENIDFFPPENIISLRNEISEFLYGCECCEEDNLDVSLYEAVIEAAETIITKADPSSTKIQSLVFSKEKFTRDQAVQWCKDHKFKAAPVLETENAYRIRQKPSGSFSKIRTIQLNPGVSATIGIK